MNIFSLRDKLIQNYSDYVRSFFSIRDARIQAEVRDKFDRGLLWPEVLIQLNPNFKPGGTISSLVADGTLHPLANKVFQRDKSRQNPVGKDLTLHTHQVHAIRCSARNENYVMTTGTGSGKSLSYIIPIVDHVLKRGSGKGISAIIVYPMNALANSQQLELGKFVEFGFGTPPVTFRRYTGQESDADKQQIVQNPPDVLLTNYVMLELILTRPEEAGLVAAAKGLRFLVLDELHTYRGRQGADVAFLVRRLRNRIDSDNLLCVGTSATMGGSGSPAEQRAEVSRVAGLLFGAPVPPENVIGETLQPATSVQPPTPEELRAVLHPMDIPPQDDFGRFTAHPLARWVERTFGLREDPLTRALVREVAKPVAGEKGAAKILAQETGVDVEICAEAIRKTLLAGYECRHPETDRPLFAFRLHQFISKGGTVYASLEDPDKRHLTLNGQQFVPNDRSRVLLPLVFCRECGQEFYCVSGRKDPTGTISFDPRDLGQKPDEGDEWAGFLLINQGLQWPTDDPEGQLSYVPEDWLEMQKGQRKIRSARRDAIPEAIGLSGLGVKVPEGRGQPATFLQAPFRFCPSCKVSYDFRQRSDISKLTTLGTEGRSTATTILSLFTLLGLLDEHAKPEARKLLSFTDNRQDASLQAGHYNDFVEVGLIRAALHLAAKRSTGGLRHEELPKAVVEALDIPFGEFAADPGVKGMAEKNTQATLREVISYRIYRDLKRGWRVIMPNLEQCGLLEIDYESLEDLAKDADIWKNCHPALVGASPALLSQVCRDLLDHCRRGLAIKVDCLEFEKQEQIRMRSTQRLRDPWRIDDDEKMEHAGMAFPRSRLPGDTNENLFISPFGGFGMYLRRKTTFPHAPGIKAEETRQIIEQLFEALKTYGLVEEVCPRRDEDHPAGYRVVADAMIWKAGLGTAGYHDRIRTPGLPEEGIRTNAFFTRFYQTIAARALGTEALEHTAQIPAEEREIREKRFRRGSLVAQGDEPKGLPILYCSPTMELGIDIAELNLVNLRNVPPTPANYAQRSGRAGRSGTPALVFSYCTIGNSHDQYFFNRPHLMVSGSVSAPRIELANEDLVRAHVHAIWLAESGLKLGRNLTQLLSLEGETPTLALQPSVADALAGAPARTRAKARTHSLLASIQADLAASDWWTPDWIERTVEAVAVEFEAACERWRGLYRASLNQFHSSSKIIVDHTRSHVERQRAESLQSEAKKQLSLLTEESNLLQSDFYSYRYFASEGFLPGYSFPRLPLSAFIPGSRHRSRKGDEYVSRPRFLAISEFGPQAILYHAGAKYQITRALMPLSEEGVLLRKMKLCPVCGYLHHGGVVETLTNCDNCQSVLASIRDNLFRMESVATRKRERINSDEEERFRQGFDVISGIRFPERDGQPSFRQGAAVAGDGTVLFQLFYGSAATLWRINRGWRRRKPQDPEGFLLDTHSGRWQASKELQEEEDAESALTGRVERVIPYVEDRRNALLVVPGKPLELDQMASLQAALKQGIQITYQLEESELATEPLPSTGDRRRILLYESAEGGAGVLRQILADPTALREVARAALSVCHYDPDTGTDFKRAPGMEEDCEAACYQCLLSYGNQRDHRAIDRQKVKDLLLALRDSTTQASSGPKPRSDHFTGLHLLCQSDLEREWLQELEDRSLRLPTHAQYLMERFGTRPDFFYRDQSVVIYVDGRHHDFPDRARRDRDQQEQLEDRGFRVIRFHHAEDWDKIFTRYQHLFGKSI